MCSQQDQNGARAAIHFPGAGKCQYGSDPLQVPACNELQYRPAVAGAQTLAVDHPDDTGPMLNGFSQKAAQRRFGGGAGAAMQVDLAINPKLSGAQATEQALADSGAPEQQGIAGFMHGLQR